jgi:hypothetical protein
MRHRLGREVFPSSFQPPKKDFCFSFPSKLAHVLCHLTIMRVAFWGILLPSIWRVRASIQAEQRNELYLDRDLCEIHFDLFFFLL